MDKDLVKLIRIYGTKNHKDVSDFIKSCSQASMSTMLMDLLTEYFNDKNSSTLREFLLLSLHGFQWIPDKIGYNGFRTSSINSKLIEYCEVKPKNIITGSSVKNRKLDGGGNFTDYTWKKFARHKKENPVMLIGGFIDGRLIYSFKFNFKSKSFNERIEHQLENKFPDGRDIAGYYLRSASFSLKHYVNVKQLETNVYVTADELQNCKGNMTRQLFECLLVATNDTK